MVGVVAPQRAWIRAFSRVRAGSRGSTSSCSTCSPMWLMSIRSTTAPTVISPRVGWVPRRSSCSADSSPSRPAAALGPRGDPVEQLAHGQGPVATDGRDPFLVGLDPPERDGFRVALEDPLDLSHPVRNHLGHVRQQLRRIPARLGFGPEVLAGRPRRARFDVAAQRVQPRFGRRAAGRRCRSLPCLECRTSA